MLLSRRSRVALRLGGLALLFVGGTTLPPLPGLAAPHPTRRVVIAGYPGGRLRRRAEYRDGVLEGTVQGWYPNGVRAYEYHYLNGRPAGLQRSWNPDGTLRVRSLAPSGATESPAAAGATPRLPPRADRTA